MVVTVKCKFMPIVTKGNNNLVDPAGLTLLTCSGAP